VTRTLLTWRTSEPPYELYELLREVSAVVIVDETAAHGLAMDHVVVWSGPNVKVDRRTLFWPADANLVRLLLTTLSSERSGNAFIGTFEDSVQ